MGRHIFFGKRKAKKTKVECKAKTFSVSCHFLKLYVTKIIDKTPRFNLIQKSFSSTFFEYGYTKNNFVVLLERPISKDTLSARRIYLSRARRFTINLRHYKYPPKFFQDTLCISLIEEEASRF